MKHICISQELKFSNKLKGSREDPQVSQLSVRHLRLLSWSSANSLQA